MRPRCVRACAHVRLCKPARAAAPVYVRLCVHCIRCAALHVGACDRSMVGTVGVRHAIGRGSMCARARIRRSRATRYSRSAAPAALHSIDTLRQLG
jgi:hypothetical protein